SLHGREVVLARGFPERMLMPIKLSPPMAELLREAVSKRRPHLAGLLASLEDVELTDSQRDELWDAVADEFSETGLKEDDEPNERGLMLEDLIGRLRRP
ncbi:MAG: hypothetical protein WAV20_09875, partial [Blastocatellia bacterium]